MKLSPPAQVTAANNHKKTFCIGHHRMETKADVGVFVGHKKSFVLFVLFYFVAGIANSIWQKSAYE